jgi:hypothetical protein
MVETWGKVPARKPGGKGLPPEQKQPQPGWHYLQVVKRREGSRVVEVKVEVMYGNETTLDLVGANTAYVERTNLTLGPVPVRGTVAARDMATESRNIRTSNLWLPHARVVLEHPNYCRTIALE